MKNPKIYSIISAAYDVNSCNEKNIVVKECDNFFVEEVTKELIDGLQIVGVPVYLDGKLKRSEYVKIGFNGRWFVVKRSDFKNCRWMYKAAFKSTFPEITFAIDSLYSDMVYEFTGPIDNTVLLADVDKKVANLFYEMKLVALGNIELDVRGFSDEYSFKNFKVKYTVMSQDEYEAHKEFHDKQMMTASRRALCDAIRLDTGASIRDLVEFLKA